MEYQEVLYGRKVRIPTTKSKLPDSFGEFKKRLNNNEEFVTIVSNAIKSERESVTIKMACGTTYDFACTDLEIYKEEPELYQIY